MIKIKNLRLIKASVGLGGVNKPNDVRMVQELLNEYRQPPLEKLKVNGVSNEMTMEAIRIFQQDFTTLNTPDGRVDPGGKTIKALMGGIDLEEADQLSGANWFNTHVKRYATSTSTDDLTSPFRENVKNFITALEEALKDDVVVENRKVKINSTRRHHIRALLMHYSWNIAKGFITAADADKETRIRIRDLKTLNIKWDHGDINSSRRAAQEMVAKFVIRYDLKVAPSLTSNHIAGNAIDMNINWSSDVLNVKGADGVMVKITSTPKNNMNEALHEVGKGYGVIKYGHRVKDNELTGKASPKDVPHWSHTGG